MLYLQFQATLAREIAEEARAHDWLLRLQVTIFAAKDARCCFAVELRTTK